jgi:hypothetical protein
MAIMAQSETQFIPGFQRLTASVWQYRPKVPEIFDDKATLAPSNSPGLILLFPWTGAIGRHVSKYTDIYQSRFPSSPIVVITTSLRDLCLRSSAKKQANLQPLIDFIRATYGGIGNALVHCFSEGGSNKAVEFAEAYHASVGEKLPCMSLCLDSTPGKPRFFNLCNAIKRSLPDNPVVRTSGFVIGSVFLGGCWAVYSVVKGYKNNVISKTRRRLNDETYWNLEVPRAYMFSKSDDLIFWEDVKEHADDAAQRGVPTWQACFDKSPHCGHIKEDSNGYWDVVMTAWESRLSPTNKESVSDQC